MAQAASEKRALLISEKSLPMVSAGFVGVGVCGKVLQAQLRLQLNCGNTRFFRFLDQRLEACNS